MNHAPHPLPGAGAQALDVLERIRGAARGEPQARRALIEALSPELIQALSPIIRGSVTRALRRRAGARRAVEHEVDDVVQTVLLGLFTGEGGALTVWDPQHRHALGLEQFVAVVAAREVDAILRSRRRNPWSEEAVVAEALDEAPVSRAGPETQAGSRRLLLAVAAHLRASVSPLGLSVFERLFLQGHTPEEVAGDLGLRVAAVYTWRSRLSRAAREIVADLERARVPRAAQPRATGRRARR